MLWLLAMLNLLLPMGARAGALPGELPSFVGRLSALQGDVRWYDRDSGTWQGSSEQALRNWPLTAGDRLRTGAEARAELRVGSTTVRLGSDVDLTLVQLDESRLLLRLDAGTLALRLSSPSAVEGMQVEIVTPEGRWLPMRPGHYRLDRQPLARTPATQGTAWRGELRFEAQDSQLLIPAGRRADLWQDTPRGPTRFAWAPVDRDAFADWVARDERLDDAPVTARHVPPDMTGWQDLDRHGDWIDHPEFGSVWQPRSVAVGWAPFHDGRWAWVAPWGWTWIDAAPWGFAPFHYGSWVMFSGRWCWSPGPRHVRPRFAPAHSAWISTPSVVVGIQLGGGYRPPPPRVVVPVVVSPPWVGPRHPRQPEARPPVGLPLPAPRQADRPDDHHQGRPDDGRRPGRPESRRGDDRDSQRPMPEGDRGAQPWRGGDRPVGQHDVPVRAPDRVARADRADRADPQAPQAPQATQATQATRPVADADARQAAQDRADAAVRHHRQDPQHWR